MKYLISFLFVITFTKINAQKTKELVVTYDIHYNTELPNIKLGTLQISNDKKQSIFTITQKKKENKKKVEIGDDNNITIRTISNKQRFVYFNYDIDTTYTTSKLFSKNYLIKEKVPKINWRLLKEKKKIGNLNVQKATTNFRGRNYTAWYSLDYPIKFGPWKFHGLPGLIIEIYDESNRYHWILKTINNGENSSFNLNKKDYKEINLKEYVKIRDSDSPNFLTTKFPRGTRVVSSKKSPRNSIETKFEWEEEKKKQ
jgi:GLPGLI family protein